jgi:CheY-like chemotaxis protein
MSRQNIKLFAVSFLMLFMEIFLIRWISTEVRIFAYVSNLVLLACFLGIGVGCYFAKKEMNIFITLGMLVLIAISVKSFPFYRITDMLSGFSDSAIWFEFTQGSAIMAAQGVVLTIYMFLMILVAFVPLGQLLGNLLDSHKNIILAYSINIAGSLIGIWTFNMFSLFYTKPWLWFLFSLALLVCFMPWSKQNFSLAAVGSVLILIVTSLSNPNILTVWSPYQKLEVFPTAKKGVQNGNLITVNNVSYMSVTDLSRDFLKSHPNLYETEELNFNQYEIPYKCSDAKKNVLIVEDDNFVAEVYSTKLLEMGHKVRIAQNGEEGLKMIGEEKPDLILLDIIMPVMGGIEMLGELKKKDDYKQIPVILLTNVGEKESVQKVMNLGVQDYLIKSHFTPAEVIEKIEAIIRK